MSLLGSVLRTGPVLEGLSVHSDISDCYSNPYLAALPSFQGSNLGLIVLGFSEQQNQLSRTGEHKQRFLAEVGSLVIMAAERRPIVFWLQAGTRKDSGVIQSMSLRPENQECC